jgi:pyrroline-5-carboxylate reductase
MIQKIGIIGVGHLAQYIVMGLRQASAEIHVTLSPRNRVTASDLAARYGAIQATDNQSVVDAADLILLTTRSEDTISVCREVRFRSGQVILSTAPGVALSELVRAIGPATAVRAMPLSCAAINRGPTLLYPDHPDARELFGLLGQVHPIDEESIFTAGCVIAAYYGWVFALMDETVTWCVNAGMTEAMARKLVLETVRGATEVGLAEPMQKLPDVLETLTTAGGITAYGLGVIKRQGGLAAWVEALQAAHHRLLSSDSQD